MIGIRRIRMDVETRRGEDKANNDDVETRAYTTGRAANESQVMPRRGYEYLITETPLSKSQILKSD